jgi:hypothetical protein
MAPLGKRSRRSDLDAMRLLNTDASIKTEDCAEIASLSKSIAWGQSASAFEYLFGHLNVQSAILSYYPDIVDKAREVRR